MILNIILTIVFILAFLSAVLLYMLLKEGKRWDNCHRNSTALFKENPRDKQ